MAFDPISLDPFHLAFTLLSAFVVVFGLLSLFSKEKLYIGEAVWATVFGIIMGPYCANVFNPRGWGDPKDYNSNEITLEVTRIVLAVGVFAIGVELPNRYIGKHWRSLAFLIGPIMVFGWFVCGGLIYALVPALDFLSALAVAACLTPTDPILAAAVVGGRYAEKHVPTHIRHLIAAESGVNDGAAFPMLFISLYLIIEKSDGVAIGEWFYATWAYEILLGTVLGSLLGWIARHVMKYCERHDLIDRHSYVAQYISLALLSNGITTILGSDDLLASFACGTAFAWDGFFNRKTEGSMFSNVIDLIFNCACFIYIGAWIPFDDFNNEALTLSWWKLLILALCVILVRRLPAILAMYKLIPEIKTFREAIFTGHFGPMGVGAVFISCLALENIPHFNPNEEQPETQLEYLASTIQPIVTFIILCSIAVHGLSIPFFSLGRRVHSISITHTRSFSRTWSRHSGPEWAHHMRKVERGEDIVINRDDPTVVEKMERGELEPMEKVVTQGSGEASGSGSSTTYDDEEQARFERERQSAIEQGKEVEGLTERDNELERDPGGEGDQELHREPARTEIKGSDSPIPEREQQPGDETEWREGRDLIIERHMGCGEEVQVEVIKNKFAEEDDEASPRSKILQGSRSHVREHIRNYYERAKNDANLAREEAEKAETKLEHATHEIEEAVEGKVHPTENSAESSESKQRPLIQVVQDWKSFAVGGSESHGGPEDKNESSDGSEEGAVEEAEESQATPPEEEEESPTQSSKSKTPFLGRSSRRESVRRSLFGGHRFAKKAKKGKAPSNSTSGSAPNVQVEPGTPSDGASNTMTPLYRTDSPLSIIGKSRRSIPQSRDEGGGNGGSSSHPSAAALRQRLDEVAAASQGPTVTEDGRLSRTPSRAESLGTSAAQLLNHSRSIRFAESVDQMPAGHNHHHGLIGSAAHRRTASGASTPRGGRPGSSGTQTVEKNDEAEQ